MNPASNQTQQPAWLRQPNQPVTYARMFAEVARARGIASEPILAEVGLPATALDDPAGRLSLADIFQLIHALSEHAGTTVLGFETGLRLPLTAHGSLGYALMCAATAGEAISILERFWHLRGRGVLLSRRQTEGRLFFEITPETPMAAALKDMMFASILTSMYRGMEFVLPMLPITRELWLTGRQPDDFEQVRDLLPRVRFQMPMAGVALLGDIRWLSQPLPTANPEALSQALAQCERESSLLDPVDSLAPQIRAALIAGPQGYPSPEALAQSLHLTTRTLRRRLQEQGSGYKQLLEEARQRDSCHLLSDSDMSIQRIADLLGYTDPANFTRAFKGWTGMTPSQWRAAAQTETSTQTTT
ncbi:MAG: AraC family transcriptional regulator [Marinobacter sp.]|nr:AraC family transcriptional regulator [Marinobacter sp.]